MEPGFKDPAVALVYNITWIAIGKAVQQCWIIVAHAAPRNQILGTVHPLKRIDLERSQLVDHPQERIPRGWGFGPVFDS